MTESGLRYIALGLPAIGECIILGIRIILQVYVYQSALP